MTRKILFAVGAALMLVNVAGLFLSLRNAEITSETSTYFKDDIVLDENELWARLDSAASDKKAYARLVNETVNKGIAHYWEDEGIDTYRLRVPITENYFLWSASWIYPPVFRKYEFSHYRKAVQRGVGLCSQHAIIVSEILKDKGIEAKIVALDGHVVAAALVDEPANRWWLLDADYGVIIPHDIIQVEKDPGIIRQYYSSAGHDAREIEKLVDIYGKQGNVVVDGVRTYDSRMPSYAMRYHLETVTYALKWIVPLLLAFPFLLGLFRKRASPDRAKHNPHEESPPIS